MTGQIKINLSLNDGDTLGGINISNGMTLNVGNVLETASQTMSPTETIMPLGYNSTLTDPPYNSTGAYIYIRNGALNSEDSYLEVKTYITTAEATGSATFLTTQRLYGGEFTWLNLASSIASGTTSPRVVEITAGGTDYSYLEYALFSRDNING